ncbi:MAG: lysophospholipid acyltransferase family protein [Desulfobulbus sp.]|nr:lysophospholipid acyltransferase family protein [Desulfobulbus sp.]
MADFLYKCSFVVVPRLVQGLLTLWFATVRVKLRDPIGFHDYALRDTGIAAFWHYSFLYLFWYLRRYPAAIMVSSSKDGAYIARLAEQMGHVPVRGSSNRGGVKALLEIIRTMQKQRLNAAIVADGSQGPARQVQAGCILMASKSGKPIFPIAWACDHFIRFKSWDQTLVPLPFSTLIVRHGEPLSVPPSLNAEQVEQYRLELEQRLNRIYAAAWNELGLLAHDLNGSGRKKSVIH